MTAFDDDDDDDDEDEDDDATAAADNDDNNDDDNNKDNHQDVYLPAGQIPKAVGLHASTAGRHSPPHLIPSQHSVVPGHICR